MNKRNKTSQEESHDEGADPVDLDTKRKSFTFNQEEDAKKADNDADRSRDARQKNQKKNKNEVSTNTIIQ